MTERRFGKFSRDLIRHGEPIRVGDEPMANGMDLAWGSRHVRVSGVIGALSLVSILLGLSLAWLVWSVGLDHRGMTAAFAEVRKERSDQFITIQRGQHDMARQFRTMLDELSWVMALAPAEREQLRYRMTEPERFRR